MTIVVDASVVVSAFIPEAHSAAAAKVLSRTEPRHAPDLLLAEVGNAFWKRLRRKLLTAEELVGMIADLANASLTLHPCRDLIAEAVRLASAYDRTVYDSLYLALAIRLDAPLVTADEKLFNAMARTPLAGRVVWIAQAAA